MNYNNLFEQVTDSRTVESNCNAILFFNYGSADVWINNFILAQGESLSLAGLAGETDISRYVIVFNPANEGETNLLFIVRKQYV